MKDLKLKGWEQYNNEQHFEFYKLVQKLYEEQMYYANDEKELFLPPQKDFVSVVEVVSNLKDPEQKAPSLQGQLKLHVQFDRETKQDKT